MSKIKTELCAADKERYLELLHRAQGDRSLSALAREAELSAGNLSRIMRGQVATPETLRRIAGASTKVTFEQLMEAAGYYRRKVETKFTASEEDLEATLALPVIRGTQLHKAKIGLGKERLRLSKALMGTGDFLLFEVNDGGFAPRLNRGDLVLIDRSKTPCGNDLAFIRLNHQDIMVRRLSRVGTKIQLYTDDPLGHPPLLVNPSKVQIFGVAVKGITNLRSE